MPKRSSNRSIRLHPEYGVNPTMPVCGWCNEPTGEIALLGSAYKGKAPMHLVVDDVPCDACKAKMAQGITIIECNDAGKSTGRWCVMGEEAFKQAVAEPLLSKVLVERRCRISQKDANDWGLFDLPAETTTGG